MTELRIYPARTVRTMDPTRSTAEAVAVAGDRIRAVGSLNELASYGPATIDDRYLDCVLFPGFVEAHSHAVSGGVWKFTYVGYFDRVAPDGRRWPGCTSIDAVLHRLREADTALTDEHEPLVAWGLDPIYFPGRSLGARELDTVSATRQILVQHVSGHLTAVNTALLAANGITRDTRVKGVVKDERGEPIGELQEMAAQSLVRTVAAPFRLTAVDKSALGCFGADACNHGVTTLVDLGNHSLMDDDAVSLYRSVVDGADFPARLSIFHMGTGGEPEVDPAVAIERLLWLRSTDSPKLRFGGVKLILDGSIQGFTARLQPPGYLPDDRRGQWVIDPDHFKALFSAFHRAGFTVHVHCNGDEATELLLDTVEVVLAQYPRWDHRHTVEHSQLSTPAQYRRMAALGMCANIFVNHIRYWGDQHRDLILGPDRASRMNAAATALRSGVPISLHSDTPVTPLDPLASVATATTRHTATGRTLGEPEIVSVPAALHATTLGAAYLIKMDHEVGSIEAGKYADFAVLSTDPFVSEPAELPDIRIEGTVVGGRHFPIGENAVE